ncbi:ABC transporter permease [Segnochrobactrum spirostomi]|uniref:ABC transporter permease n=1 Tax=Segnochrobactrum spirostomi TaxID=2608987 RepID=A0A6A7YB60_9HYPH|nr:ABC transporter permease [Segnochrobactrum spirostomi]MQT14659.1 ABC transporter permease [Segnochrobactrum spirostomi]
MSVDALEAPVSLGDRNILGGLLKSGTAVAGLALLGLFLFAAACAPLVAPYDPIVQDVANRLAPPSAAHWLGTDGFGRDQLSRLIYGTRPTLGLVLLVTVASLPLGLAIGIVAGTAGGWVERILMRLTDIGMAFPRLALALAFVAVFGPGLVNGALALAITGWPAYARLARAEASVIRRSDFLAAAEMGGIRGPRLLFGHVLPVVLPSATVRMALDMAGIILAAAGLGFIGLGVRPPTPDWGSMVADGTTVIFDQWWIAAAPGTAILFASLSFNLIADGLRDVLDPRHG